MWKEIVLCFKAQLCDILEWLKKTVKNSVRVIGLWVKILIHDLPNMKQEC